MAKLEIDIDSRGNPIIKITHFDRRSKNLETKLLEKFLKDTKKNGIQIREGGALIVTGRDDECYVEYFVGAIYQDK